MNDLILIALKESGRGTRLTFLDDNLREEICGEEGGELLAPTKDGVIALAISRLKSKGLKGKLRTVQWPAEPAKPKPVETPRVGTVKGERARVLKPGYIIALSTHVRGGVRRDTEILSKKQIIDGKATKEVKKVTEIVEDPEERSKAEALRGTARSMITSITTHTDFGELCPFDRGERLDEAIADMKQMVEAFNVTAKTCSVHVFVAKGTIAATDQDLVKGISMEIRDLVGNMRDAIAKGDVKEIRKAATEAKKRGTLLDASVADRVSAAVEAARKTASAIAKELVDGGDVAEVIQKAQLDALDEARFAFLDLDDAPAAEEKPKLTSVPAPALDLDVA